MGDSKETARLVRLRIRELQDQKKRWRRRLGATVVAFCICVAVFAIAATIRLSRPDGVELEDAPPPMGTLQTGTGKGLIYCQTQRLEIRPGQTAVSMPVENPADSSGFICFAVIMKASGETPAAGETIYSSPPLAPAERIEQITLDKGLQSGEYGADLVIYACDRSGTRQREEARIDIQIMVR